MTIDVTTYNIKNHSLFNIFYEKQNLVCLLKKNSQVGRPDCINKTYKIIIVKV